LQPPPPARRDRSRLDLAGDRRPAITPQLAIRVAGAGVVAFVLFGIIFFRLWYLEVLDGDKYLARARENRVRTERIAAPRGKIVDANKVTLVDDRKATVVAINPASIPATTLAAIADYGQATGRWALRKQQYDKKLAKLSKKQKTRVAKLPSAPARPLATGALLARYRRLASVLQMSAKTINNRVVDAIVQVPYANVRIRTDVPAAQRNFIQERSADFPGVTVSSVYERSYPNHEMAAQVLGTIGQINGAELASKKFKGVAPGTDVGQSGLEYTYDNFLRGTDGRTRIEVNAAGERRQLATAVQPKAGQQLKLTLRKDIQDVGDAALKQAGGGRPGAFVALDPDTGAVYAMGSSPSYNPRDAAPGRYSTTAAYTAKFIEASTNFPLIDRADESAYPTGSIFKPITSLAALDAGVIETSTVFDDTGCYQTGARQEDRACNTNKTPYGPITMVDALRVSSDTYYYNLGKKLYEKGTLKLQKWAHDLGVARKTGIDLPGERTGLIPSPSEVRRINELQRACVRKHPKGNCQIGSGNALWNPGDNENFAVGQGGLEATPLQMAVAYSAIINGGRVPTPYVGAQVEDSRGIVTKFTPPSRRSVRIDPAWRSTIMNGLHEAANQSGGTSKAVWDQGWPRSKYPIFGKTGTAERNGQNDQSWYVGYSYDGSPTRRPILVVCTIEGGGFGAEAAAPAVRLIMSQWFGVTPKLVRGSSNDR
jgi:penicillin-binding protein 2